MIGKTIHMTYRLARRVVVSVVGITVVALGVVMIVTPGPAFVVIPVGLAILSIEFTWARLWLRKLRRVISNNSRSGRSSRAEEHRKRVAP